MSEMTVIGAGGGGKGGGGGGGISESPDTLSSNAYVQFIDVIGEGEISGLVNAEASIYLNGVPLRDTMGTANYQGFTWAQAKGTPAQAPLNSFRTIEDETMVNVLLRNTMGPVTRSIVDAGADAVRVTVSVSGLSQTTKEGKLNGASVQYRIDVRVSGGSWREGEVLTITGKTSSRYQRQHLVELGGLGPGPYEVRVTRLTADASTALIVDALTWDSFTVVNRELLGYPNTALIGLKLDAKYFSQIPTRSYHVRGLLIRVPRNYNPVTREYATTGVGTTNGAWDGTFKTAYSNNPAWCFYDICTNKRYGLGERISEAQVDKWALYEIAKYCDEMVPRIGAIGGGAADTGGGRQGLSLIGRVISKVLLTNSESQMEPRFTLNCVINSRDDAYRVLNQLTSAFRGMSYWANNQVFLTQDRPTDPSMLFTNANVEKGTFTYEGSARSQRNTVVLVGWNDPSEDFKQKFEYVEDREGIARYGIRTTDIIAFGCTSASQARRVGMWMLYTQRLESAMVHFKAGLDSSHVMPGDVVKILDSHRAGARWGGRLVGSTLTQLEIDAAVNLTAGTYTISVMMPDGEIASRQVTVTTGDHSTFMVAALPAVPVDGAIWTLASTNVEPMLARVVAVKQDGANGYLISALEHNPSKYEAIERDAQLREANYSFLTYDSAQSVTGLTAIESTLKTLPSAPPQYQVDVSWQASTSPAVRGYVVSYRSEKGDIGTMPETRYPSITLTNLTIDHYTVEVKAVNTLGLFGPTSSTTVEVTGNVQIPNDPRPAQDLTGLHVTPAFAEIEIGWDWPSFDEGGGNGKTEILAADYSGEGPLPQITDATPLAFVDAAFNTYVDQLEPNRQRHYWARHVTRFGTPSSSFTGGTTGVSGKTGELALSSLTLTSSPMIFKFKGVEPTPPDQKIQFKALTFLSGTPAWEAKTYDADGDEIADISSQLIGTGKTRTLNVAAFGAANSCVVKVTVDGQSDQQTILRLTDGSSSITALLTNEAHVVSTAADGSGGDYSGAGGAFRLYLGTNQITTGVVYSVVSSSGITGMAIDASGVYSLTGMTEDQGTATLRAVYSGTTIEKVYKVSKTKAGSSGGFIDYIFRRSATTPPTPTGNTPAGWFDAPPAGSDPLYMSKAPKNSNGTLRSGGSWSTPVRIDGADGKSVQVQYSVDGVTNWHTPFTAGDLYMRQSTDGGATWTAAIRIVGEQGPKGDKGDPGGDGAPGLQTATVELYQWLPYQPGNPSGGSTYTWASATHSGYGGANGWSTTVLANPGTPGMRLWAASKSISASGGTAQSSVTWTENSFTVYAVGQNGSNGIPGLQSATPTVYRWDVGSPTAPTGNTNFVWASQTFDAPSNWTLNPGNAPYKGLTLYAATVSIQDSAGSTSYNFSWSNAVVRAVGYAGTDGSKGDKGDKGDTGSPGNPGSPGPQGGSARVAYARLAGNPSPVSNLINHLGDSPPSSAESSSSWGISATWSSTDPSPSSTNALYVTDGIYNPSTGYTVWSTPYLASLKVGSLSAITVNATSLNVDVNMTMASGGAISSAPFTNSYNWPTNSYNPGFHLSANGLMIGNYYSGRWFEARADGYVSMPGLTINNGIASFTGQLNGATGNFSGSLNAATGSFGDISITGLMSTPGKGSYDSGTGVMLGRWGGQAYLGVTSTASGTLKGMWIGTHDGVLNVSGAVITNSSVNFAAFSATVYGGGNVSGNSGSGFLTTNFGSASVSPSGGTAPYSYRWSVSNHEIGTLLISTASGTSVGVTARTPYSGTTLSTLTCTVTDANGRSASASVLYSVTNGPV